jgi:hypothetical protein
MYLYFSFLTKFLKNRKPKEQAFSLASKQHASKIKNVRKKLIENKKSEKRGKKGGGSSNRHFFEDSAKIRHNGLPLPNA